MYTPFNRSDFDNSEVRGFPDLEHLYLGISSIRYELKPLHICQLNRANSARWLVHCWEKKEEATDSSITHAMRSIAWIALPNQKSIISESHSISILAVMALVGRSHGFNNDTRIVDCKILQSCTRITKNLDTCLLNSNHSFKHEPTVPSLV